MEKQEHITILMMYIKNWVCKCKFVFKYTSKRFFQMLETVLALLGLILTIGECMDKMFDSDIIFTWMQDYAKWILLVCVIVAFLRCRVRLKYEYFLNGSDVKISMQVMDVFSAKNAIVIPTNTTFDTKMEDEFISIKSVQGQFQKKYFDNNLGTLDSLLEKGLEGCEYKEVNRVHSKNRRYPIGTVSKVTHDRKHFYFVAIADINEHGKPINTKFENVQLALEGVWRELENKGHIENLAIPLIGTGRAGIKGASRKKVIQETIFSFVASAKERKITEELQICIHPLDLAHKDLDLQDLNEYLHYMCKYRYEEEESPAEGNVILF